MISSDNQPNRATTADEDFTEAHYRELLRAAQASYRFATYDAIPWGTRFILWRHDLDFSINRAAALAAIEAEEGTTATYFVNPHSEYYNPFEPGQARLIRRILEFGHRLGLHLDGAFHNIQNEEQLHSKVAEEGRWLQEVFGVCPDAFSFHNPGAANLQCGADHYGGLTNCYSHRFKTEVPYCSDSNGYWRFRRLHDVLIEATDPCLQVLTHPGWWQEKPMPPRQRIFRAAYGRAATTMCRYDEGLIEYRRLNHAGASGLLTVFKAQLPERFLTCDFLWNIGAFEALFTELWRLHETQLIRLCKAILLKEWQVPVEALNDFWRQEGIRVSGSKLFRCLFGDCWLEIAGTDDAEYTKWLSIRNQCVRGKEGLSSDLLELGCIYVCKVVASLSDWGASQLLAYDGLVEIDSIALSTHNASDSCLSERSKLPDFRLPFSSPRWEAFKMNIAESSISNLNGGSQCG